LMVAVQAAAVPQPSSVQSYRRCATSDHLSVAFQR